MGGDCTWTGCIPSKSLIASAKAAHAVTKASKFGINIDGKVTIDMKAIKKRVDENIQQIYDEDDSPEALKKLGVHVIKGAAKFKDSKTLSVTTDNDSENDDASAPSSCIQICANYGILIATGARPRAPTIPGINEVDYITYEEAFSLEEIPDTITVIGGGPIGCELAQAYSRLGAKVTVVASALLPREEPEVGQVMQRVFEAEGIKVTNSLVESVVSVSGGSGSGKAPHTAICKDGQQVNGDLLLVAVGRTPVVNGMDLEALGVELNEKGGIKTDNQLLTSVKGLYAAGDCTGDRQFTHYAGYQGAVSLCMLACHAASLNS